MKYFSTQYPYKKKYFIKMSIECVISEIVNLKRILIPIPKQGYVYNPSQKVQKYYNAISSHINPN